MTLFTETDASPLPLFRELMLDENGMIVREKDGSPKIISGAEALCTWVRKALHPQCARFSKSAYTNSYGNELSTLVGASAPEAESRLAELIRSALLVSPYITAVEDFSFTTENGAIRAAFRVNTVYGSFNYESEARLS